MGAWFDVCECVCGLWMCECVYDEHFLKHCSRFLSLSLSFFLSGAYTQAKQHSFIVTLVHETCSLVSVACTINQTVICVCIQKLIAFYPCHCSIFYPRHTHTTNSKTIRKDQRKHMNLFQMLESNKRERKRRRREKKANKHTPDESNASWWMIFKENMQRQRWRQS